MADADTAPVAGTRRDILRRLKLSGPQTSAALAGAIGISLQALSQQLATLQRDDLVSAAPSPRNGREGRPALLYCLTDSGEATFPRNYQALVLMLIDAIGAEMGATGMTRVLEAVTRLRIERYTQLVAGLSLRDRLDVLVNLYQEDDPYLTITETDGGYLLTERNCPFLQIAMKRPALCSTTVSVLMHVLGVRVERVRRFQDGHGCCAFRIYANEPIATGLPMFIPERQAG